MFSTLSTSLAQQEQKKTRLRFSGEDDLCLLRTVIAENPFADPYKWEIVRATVVQITGKMFSQRTVVEHVEYLLKLFTRDDWTSRKKSGTKEQHMEKEILLQEIKDLSIKFKHIPRKIKQISTDRGEYGIKFPSNTANIVVKEENNTSSESSHVIVPDEIVTSYLSEDDQSNDSVDSASQTSTNLDPLGTSHLRKRRKKEQVELKFKQRQLEIEAKRLELDERKLALEEAKFQLEKTERLKRLEMDARDREAFLVTLKYQQELIMSLMEKYKC